MIVVDDVILSDDIKDNFFVCDLAKCKGACCVEGDMGAPLTAEEAEYLDENMDKIVPFLEKKGVDKLRGEGPYMKEVDGDLSTPTLNGRECAYAYRDKKGVLKCGIEKAHLEGKISFKKPISCHLYPIRVSKYDHYEALNYDRWHICSPACHHGNDLKVPLYKFLKESLIRKYGAGWYSRLVKQIEGS